MDFSNPFLLFYMVIFIGLCVFAVVLKAIDWKQNGSPWEQARKRAVRLEPLEFTFVPNPPKLPLDEKIMTVANMSEELSRLNNEIKAEFHIQLLETRRLKEEAEAAQEVSALNAEAVEATRAIIAGQLNAQLEAANLTIERNRERDALTMETNRKLDARKNTRSSILFFALGIVVPYIITFIITAVSTH